MNKKKLQKRRLEFITQRRNALNEIDAIYDAVDKSADKKETAEQLQRRQAAEQLCRNLELDIERMEERISRAESQENFEARSAGRRRGTVHADDDENNDADGDTVDSERLHELEQREEAGNLSTAEARELRRLRSAEDERAEGHIPRNGGGDMNSGLSRADFRALQGFSYLRAFNARLDEKRLDGVEGEMHAEGEKEYREHKLERNGGNLIIPQIVLRSAGCVGGMEYRDLSATGGSLAEGGFTVATQLGSMVDRLRKKLIMQQMGVTMLGGLQGNLDIPKVAADDQAVEKAETAVSAESSATFSKISMAPRRLPIFAEVSRQLLLQSSVDVEAWLRSDLAFQVAQVMDARAISGSGVSQPYGILNAVGVGAVALGTNGLAPTYDMIIDLETAVANLDADVGALGYITNTKTRGKLKKTLVAANTAGEMIWDRKNPASPLNEYRTGITNLVPSNLVKGTSGAVCSAMIFGNYNDAMMGQWGGLEFLINPYSRDTEGLIRINCWTFFDFLLRRTESFAVCKDILTT
jgi:HK97 family phage major capsid protein